MKKICSDGFGLIQTENAFAFRIYNEDKNQTYFQYNGEKFYEISKKLYIENMFGINSKKITNQLLHPNIDYIESIAKCSVQVDGVNKLLNLTEYYDVTFGSDWRVKYNFDWLPKDILDKITSFNVCTINGNIICHIWPDDIILHFDRHGELTKYILLGVTDYCDTLYQICSDGQSIWGVSPTMNTVVRYEYPSFKLEREYHYENINGEDDKLNYPEYISFADGQLFICDMENNRIVTLNPQNGEIKTYISLFSKPFEFLKWKNHFVISASDGLYLVEALNKSI